MKITPMDMVQIVPCEADIKLNKRTDSFLAEVCEVNTALQTVTVEDFAGLTWVYSFKSVIPQDQI